MNTNTDHNKQPQHQQQHSGNRQHAGGSQSDERNEPSRQNTPRFRPERSQPAAPRSAGPRRQLAGKRFRPLGAGGLFAAE